MFNSINIKSKMNGYYSVHFVNSIDEITTKSNEIFIIDELVYNLHFDIIKGLIKKNQFILINASEQNKTIDYSQILIKKLIDCNIRRDYSLVAIGGGITQDIVAFISSIIFRGINWKFIPTTLLAQCDSCIGSKSSINFNNYKNLLGTFKPPSEIYIYNEFLKTLTESEIKSGIGEMLHYFLFDGINIANDIKKNYYNLFKTSKNLIPFIKKSLSIKKNIIEIDEFDQTIRHLFNYGHTFGHAIENITNYKIPHGQAVTIGMDLANYISYKKGFLSKQHFNQMHRILKLNFPNFNFNTDNVSEYLNALSKDKKNIENKIGAILCLMPGKLEKIFIENDNDLKSLILDYNLKYLN